jgi:hypothetical protein
MTLTLRNQDEKGRAWSLAKDQACRDAAASALREVQTLRMSGIVDIATVAALLFVPAKKTCTQDVSADDPGIDWSFGVLPPVDRDTYVHEGKGTLRHDNCLEVGDAEALRKTVSARGLFAISNHSPRHLECAELQLT